jgi:hypothetical protein
VEVEEPRGAAGFFGQNPGGIGEMRAESERVSI